MPGGVGHSVRHLTRKSEVLGLISGRSHTFVSPSDDSRGAVVSYWRRYVHEVLVNRLGGLSLPWKSVVKLANRPDMIIDVYCGRKTTTTQQQQQQHHPVLEIKSGKRDNLERTFSIFCKTYMPFIEIVLMRSHNIYFR